MVVQSVTEIPTKSNLPAQAAPEKQLAPAPHILPAGVERQIRVNYSWLHGWEGDSRKPFLVVEDDKETAFSLVEVQGEARMVCGTKPHEVKGCQPRRTAYISTSAALLVSP